MKNIQTPGGGLGSHVIVKYPQKAKIFCTDMFLGKLHAVEIQGEVQDLPLIYSVWVINATFASRGSDISSFKDGQRSRDGRSYLQ